MQILNERQENLIHNERKTLNDLRLAMVEFGGKTEDSDLLGKSVDQLDELFLLVVVGEFNSGKSAFINALLGQKSFQRASLLPPARSMFFNMGRNTNKRWSVKFRTW